MNIRWKQGTLGTMGVTMITYPENLEGSITILGEKGSVRVGGVAVNEIITWDFLDSRDYDLDINMWSNSNGDQIKNIFLRLNKIDLSEDANEIMRITLLTNAHYPKQDIKEKEFLKLSEEIIKF